MDIASLVGVLVACGCIYFIGHHASDGHWSMFFSMEGIVAVFGGSISLVFMAMPLDKLLRVGSYLRCFMFHKGKDAVDIVKQMTTYSEMARRNGMLSLESELGTVDDPFLAAGLKMVIDGMGPETVEMTLRTEILAMQERHKAGKKFFDLIKLYAPGWGLVATLIGQIGMFGQLGGKVEAIGKALALAVAATMYGALLANAIAGPIGDKLALRSSEEIVNREMVLQGLLSVQAGDNPRVVQELMMAFIPQSRRQELRKAA
jgi:chemotaxis protein MotA